MPILQTTDLKKYYGEKPNITKALDGVSLSVEHGEFVAIVGTSGSGKSTLLNMIGGLDVPTSGKVIVDGKDLSTLKDEQLTIFRRRKIGFIFQNYNLVPVLNVYENIVLPVELDGDQVDKNYMQEVVRMLGLEDRLNNMPNNLSGGQQQRVAIARALVSKPAIVLADEPTGNLDSRTSSDVLGLLKVSSQKFHQTLVMITHNNEIAQLADRIVPIIKKLSRRYFKASKSRNIIAIVAIILTTVLFTTIFTLGSGLIDTVQDQNIRKMGGDGQAVLNYISDEVFDDVKGNELIDRIAYTKAVSYHLNNPGLAKWRSDMWYMDDTALEFARYEPTTGHRPEAENEIIADTKTLEALGVPAEIGATVTLDYEIKGKEYTTDFTLCGFWETDSLSNIGRIIVSKAFIDSHADLLTYTYPVDNDYSGIVTAYIMFRGSGSVEEKLQQLLTETGYTCDTLGGQPTDARLWQQAI